MVEPETVFRAAAFLAGAAGDAVGGPCSTRPASACTRPGRGPPADLGFAGPGRPGRPRTRRRRWTGFAAGRPVHYNGWWFFAFPLAAVDRVGLPLPLFIRGDDVEYGLRLLGPGCRRRGPRGGSVARAVLPQDRRVAAVLRPAEHAGPDGPAVRGRPGAVARVFLARLIGRLLCSTTPRPGCCAGRWRTSAGGRGWSRAPPGGPPGGAGRAGRGGPGELPAAGPPPAWAEVAPPASRAGRAWLRPGRWSGRWSAAARPPGHPRGWPSARPAGWWTLGRADVVAVEARYGERCGCSAGTGAFVRLLGRGLRAAARLYRRHPAVAAAWGPPRPG